MKSKYDAAYLAGIIDAKGCFSVYKRKTPKGFRYSIGLKILSSRKKLPHFMMKHVGYGHLHSYISTFLGGKRVWTWELFPADLMKFLNVHIGFLKLKKSQAQLLIEYHKLDHDKNVEFNDKLKLQAKMYDRCRKLKKL